MKISNWLIYQLTRHMFLVFALFAGAITLMQVFSIFYAVPFVLGLISETMSTPGPTALSETYSGSFILALPDMLVMAGSAFCCWRLSQLLRSIGTGKSFSGSNFQKMLQVGYTIMGINIVLIALSFVSNLFPDIIRFSQRHINQDGFNITITSAYSPNITWLAIGMAVVIFAYAFRKGRELQVESETTV